VYLLSFVAIFLAPLAQEFQILELDRARLEQVEELSESLANQLLEMSVALRRQDIAQVARSFPESDSLQGTLFPVSAGSVSPDSKWLLAHTWELDTETTTHTSAELLTSLESFLQHFREISDVRFKVKHASFDDSGSAVGTASVYFFLVGRNHEAEREWVRGWVDVEATQRPDSTWAMTTWRITELASMVSKRDLFSEITEPLGLAQDVPRFGVPPNDGFVAHGVAVADVDLDGELDIFTSGVTGNRLFLNNAGTNTSKSSASGAAFEDVSDETLVLLTRPGTGTLFLDYDNDGDQDIFMAAVGEQMILQNQLRPGGHLEFVDVSVEAGVDHRAVGFSPVAADVNGDGHTDVYVCSYNLYGQVMPNSWTRADNGTPNLLFINQGDGTFRERARQWGVADARWGYAAGFADVDGDSRQDLYLANDFGENALFMNRGDHFEDEATARGVLDPGNGMGVSFGDYDNDGDLDLHVTNMSSTAGNRILARLMPEAKADDTLLKKLAAGNSLYRNAGDGTFENVASSAGGFGAGWAYGGGFIDFDNDGWQDLYSVNGFVSGKTMNDT
jgi:hypothetical protein